MGIKEIKKDLLLEGEKPVYSSSDLGFGLHISLDPEHYEALIPQGFVVHTSLGKLYPRDVKDWDLAWEYCKKRGHAMVDALNDGTLTEEQVTQEINEINEGLKAGKVYV
tara:strand:- start:33967 stop:34293 length:327 start_codon:yes stop_codon:yes gene_type:complete